MTSMTLASAYIGGAYFFVRVLSASQWKAIKSGFSRSHYSPACSGWRPSRGRREQLRPALPRRRGGAAAATIVASGGVAASRTARGTSWQDSSLGKGAVWTRASMNSSVLHTVICQSVRPLPPIHNR